MTRSERKLSSANVIEALSNDRTEHNLLGSLPRLLYFENELLRRYGSTLRSFLRQGARPAARRAKIRTPLTDGSAPGSALS
jgi:hypothetical protein